LVVVSGVGFFFADEVISVFKDNENVIMIGRQALQMQLITHPIMSFVVLGNMMAQNLGKVVRASLLAVARQGVLLIPCVLLLPQLFGMWGIIISQPVADLATFLLTIVLVTPILKELKTLSKQNV